MFSRQGFPEIFVSDNGSNLTSSEFNEYLSSCGITHRTVTPYWPQANGIVERFNRTLLKAIKVAVIENKDWRSSIYDFLLDYRSTPHYATRYSPAELLYQRNLKNYVPTIDVTSSKVNINEAIRNNDRLNLKTKDYVDENRHSKFSTIKEGDKVLLKKHNQRK